MNKEHVFFSVDLQSDETNGPKLFGYAAVFDQLSEDLGGYRARINRGAFNNSLASKNDILALVDHDVNKPLGSRNEGTLKFTLDDKGLKVEITPPDVSYARDAFALVKAKLKKGMSFGFPTDTAKIRWTQEGDVKVREFSDLQLEEVSVVTRPAFSQTNIAATFSLDSAENKKDQNKEKPKHNTVSTKGNPSMSLSWTDIKKLEEQKAVTFGKANALKDRNDLSEDETAELDRLCGEVDALDGKITDAKSTYFGRNVARKNVTQQFDVTDSRGNVSDLKTIGFKSKDIQRYSLLRAISRRLNGQPLDGIEAEVNEEMIKFTGKLPQGFFFPMELSLGGSKFDLTTSTGSGSVSTDTLGSSFIELLRANTLVDRLGVTYLTNLVGNVSIPKQTAGGSAYWVSEGNAPSESNQTVGQVPLSPKTVGTFSDISRKFILQSSLAAEAFVRNDLAKAIALEIDRVAFDGTGASDMPTGVLHQSGITEFQGSSDKFGDMVDLETAVEDGNALNGPLSYVMRPGQKGSLKTTAVVTNGTVMVWEGNQVNGYSAYSSTQIPLHVSDYGNESPVIFGNWSDLVIGLWGALDILVDPYTASSSGTVRIRALQDVDLAIRNAASFAACYYPL